MLYVASYLANTNSKQLRYMWRLQLLHVNYALIQLRHNNDKSQLYNYGKNVTLGRVYHLAIITTYVHHYSQLASQLKLRSYTQHAKFSNSMHSQLHNIAKQSKYLYNSVVHVLQQCTCINMNACLMKLYSCAMCFTLVLPRTQLDS